MQGQMTYDETTKSWKFTPINKLNATICGTGKGKIQSRDNYYKAWINGKTFASTSLTELILIVESKE